jgi:transposase
MYNKDKIFDALSMYNKKDIYGISIDVILDILCIARSTLYEWIKNYGKNFDGNKNTITDRTKNKLKKHIKISAECKSFIISHVTENPDFNIKKLKRKILKIYEVRISKGYIYHILKNNDITYKKVLESETKKIHILTATQNLNRNPIY